MVVCRWLIWLAYALAWTWALLLPNPDEWARWLLGQPGDAPAVDSPLRWHALQFVESLLFSKGLHVTAYAAWAVLSAWLRVPGRYRWLLLAVLSFHAMGSEFLQGFEPSRHPSWRDVGLDHLGILLGVAATRRWWLTSEPHFAAGVSESE